MKNIYALLFTLLSTYGFSQTLSEITYDSIVKIENTELSLVYAKKKTAVWHDANFFVAQPTNNHFIFLEGPFTMGRNAQPPRKCTALRLLAWNSVSM